MLKCFTLWFVWLWLPSCCYYHYFCIAITLYNTCFIMLLVTTLYWRIKTKHSIQETKQKQYKQKSKQLALLATIKSTVTWGMELITNTHYTAHYIPVSYTHLDVYKRQIYVFNLYSYTFNLCIHLYTCSDALLYNYIHLFSGGPDLYMLLWLKFFIFYICIYISLCTPLCTLMQMYTYFRYACPEIFDVCTDSQLYVPHICEYSADNKTC